MKEEMVGLYVEGVATHGDPEHRIEQEGWREAARQPWQDDDWVFTSAVGAALNPNSDFHRWKALLKEAGVRDGRLHDARHTAATVLLVLGVPERTVMGIMGWSSTAMAARYKHATAPIRRQVADQAGGLLFGHRRGWKPRRQMNWRLGPDNSRG